MPKTQLKQIGFEVADNIIAAEKLNKNRDALAVHNVNFRDFILKVREILE